MAAKWTEFVVLVGLFLFFSVVIIFVVIPYVIVLKTIRFFRNTFNWVMGVENGRF
tara:strand:+ start:775 stop:939 length:165 start_codon:yes stop_codon:yes gene_type:complete